MIVRMKIVGLKNKSSPFKAVARDESQVSLAAYFFLSVSFKMFALSQFLLSCVKITLDGVK